MIHVKHIDHFVLTVASVKRSCRFYGELLGMEIIRSGDNCLALKFGSQKIDLHQLGSEVEHTARNVFPGSADICLVSRTPIAVVKEELELKKVPLVSEIVSRIGAGGKIESIYLHDPDGNLLEISTYTEHDI